MMTPSMYDRTEAIDMLDRQCLGPVGASASIVGAHKVGKSRLLDHIEARAAVMRDTVFCRVDLYALRGFLAKGEQLSNHTFLRLLVVQLLARIDAWIDELTLQEETWKSDIRKAEQRLSLGGVLGNNRGELERTRNVLQRQLQQLESLRDVKARSEKLVEERALEANQLWYVFNTLKKLGKRVVLLIDDFNEVIEERAFDDNLFEYLRGANNEHKIFAIVCSPVRPMEATSRRRDLFNHLQPQLLEPFSRTEAEGFLEWEGFSPANPPLSDSEKAYLYQLGGGSPHFLERARHLFLERGRPDSQQKRDQFQRKYVMPDFAPAFRAIWARCTPEERSALRELLAGKTPNEATLTDLEWKGYLVPAEAGASRPFSILFGEFVGQNPKEPSAPKGPLLQPNTGGSPSARLRIEAVEVPYKIFPTALYAAAPETAEQITFRLRNLSSDSITVQFTVGVVNYFQESRKTVILDPEQTETVALRLVFDSTREVKAPVATQVMYRITMITGNSEIVIADNTEMVRLLPLNNFLMARYDSAQGKLIDFTWLIAAWVTRTEEVLRNIRMQILAVEPLVGRKVQPGPEAATETRIRVAAIYNVLKARNIAYSDDNLVFHAEDRDYSQRVQFPVETLNEGSGNCLDGSVLFAGLLSICGIDPVILLVPGHAVVGWKIPGAVPPRWEFIEPTVIARVDFDIALELGIAVYAKRQHLVVTSDGESLQTIDNPNDFALVIDVHEVWRRRKLLPAGGRALPI